MLVECSICYEKTRDLGEIDACLHRFCFECISRWADTENRCPMCKERFIVITRKRLPQGPASHGPAPADGAGNCGSAGGGGGRRTTGVKRLRREAVATDGVGLGTDGDGRGAASGVVGASGAGGAEEVAEDEDPDAGDGPRKRLKGTVVETRVVHDRQQRWQPADMLGLDLEALRCQQCGRGDNDERLLICDGCDRGYHTYCVGLEDIPDGAWYCEECEEQRVLLVAARRTLRGRRGGAAAAASGRGRRATGHGRGRGRGRGSGQASSGSDSDVHIVGEVGGGGGSASGYDTVGEDASELDETDADGNAAAAGAMLAGDDGDGDEAIYDSSDAADSDGEGWNSDGGDDVFDGGDSRVGSGAHSGGGGGGRARRRRGSTGRGRGRARGRSRTRRRRRTTARGGSHRRGGARATGASGRQRGGGHDDEDNNDDGITLAALRERLGTTARARARTAALAARDAVAAAATDAAGEVDDVPLSQRRTVARLRLYADQMRVEMMRRQWSTMREDEAREFGRSTLGAELRRAQQQQQQQQQPTGGPGGSGGTAGPSGTAASAAATAARERALQALRAQRVQEAVAAAATIGVRGRLQNARAGGGAYGHGSDTYDDIEAGGRVRGVGAASTAAGGGDPTLAAAWQALERLRGTRGGGAANTAMAWSGRTPWAAVPPPPLASLGRSAGILTIGGAAAVASSAQALLRSVGPSALVGGFRASSSSVASGSGSRPESRSTAARTTAPEVQHSHSTGRAGRPGPPLSALIPGLMPPSNMTAADVDGTTSAPQPAATELHRRTGAVRIGATSHPPAAHPSGCGFGKACGGWGYADSTAHRNDWQGRCSPLASSSPPPTSSAHSPPGASAHSPPGASAHSPPALPPPLPAQPPLPPPTYDAPYWKTSLPPLPPPLPLPPQPSQPPVAVGGGCDSGDNASWASYNALGHGPPSGELQAGPWRTTSQAALPPPWRPGPVLCSQLAVDPTAAASCDNGYGRNGSGLGVVDGGGGGGSGGGSGDRCVHGGEAPPFALETRKAGAPSFANAHHSSPSAEEGEWRDLAAVAARGDVARRVRRASSRQRPFGGREGADSPVRPDQAARLQLEAEPQRRHPEGHHRRNNAQRDYNRGRRRHTDLEGGDGRQRRHTEEASSGRHRHGEGRHTDRRGTEDRHHHRDREHRRRQRRDDAGGVGGSGGHSCSRPYDPERGWSPPPPQGPSAAENGAALPLPSHPLSLSPLAGGACSARQCHSAGVGDSAVPQFEDAGTEPRHQGEQTAADGAFPKDLATAAAPPLPSSLYDKTTKVAACEAVKALLAPLYARQQLDKDAFKEAARAATAALCADMAAWGLGAADLRRLRGSSAVGGGDGLAAAALIRTLASMGLGHLQPHLG